MLFRPNNSEDALILKPNGAVELYFDNVKQVQTFSSGLNWQDNKKAEFGNSGDLKIYHDGSNSYIQDSGTGDLIVKTNIFRLKGTNDEAIITGTENGNVALYYDNSKKFETTTTGVKTLGDLSIRNSSNTQHIIYDESDGALEFVDSIKATFGTGNDLQIYHDGNSHIANSTGYLLVNSVGDNIIRSNANVILQPASGETGVKATANGAVELYFDNSIKLNTNSAGLRFYGSLRGNDTEKIELGSSQDLQIYHDGTDSFIKNTTGNLIIGDTTGNVILQGKFGEDSLICKPDGSVELNYDNDKVFYTETRGVRIGDNTKIFENAAHNTGIIQHADIHHSIIFRGSTNADGTTITNGNVTTFREYGNFVFRTGQINALERLIIESNGTSRFVNNNDSTNEEIAKFNPNGSVELYYDNSKKLETTSIGIDVTGKVTTDELSVIKTSGNLSAHFEAQSGLGTLEIGGSTGAFIDLKTPFSDDFDLRVDANGNLTSSGNIALVVQGNENGLRVLANGACELYHDNAKKFETTNAGADITGDLQVHGSGTSVTIKPTDGLINFGMDGRSSFVTGENSCYIFSGSGSSGDMPAGDLIIQSRSNGNRTIRFATGSTPAQRVAINHNGLLFGTDSAAANALDDYEEGTFSPHFEIETRAASDSPVTSVDATYVKVGKMVTCHYSIKVNGTPSERSNARAWEIHGFPFQSKNDLPDGYVGAGQRVQGYDTSTYGPDGYFLFRLFNHETYGRLEFIESSHNGTRNASPMMTNNAIVMGTITYQTND